MSSTVDVGDHDERARDVGLLLALEQLLVALELARELGSARDRLGRDRLVGREVDRQALHGGALVQAQRRLPVAVHRDRLGRPLDARRDLLELRRPRSGPPCPARRSRRTSGRRRPRRAGRAGRSRHLALGAAARPRQRDLGADRVAARDRCRQATTATSASAAAGSASAARAAARTSGVERAADEAADDAAGDRRDEAAIDGLGQHRSPATRSSTRRSDQAHSAASPTCRSPTPASSAEPERLGRGATRSATSSTTAASAR